jgi:predicted RNA-binding protein YlqC (UPF0109 family)
VSEEYSAPTYVSTYRYRYLPTLRLPTCYGTRYRAQCTVHNALAIPHSNNFQLPTMVATRNKRKLSSPSSSAAGATSPAAATRSSKRGKAATESPAAADTETTNSGGNVNGAPPPAVDVAAPAAISIKAVDDEQHPDEATTVDNDADDGSAAPSLVVLKRGGESEDASAVPAAESVPVESTDQEQQRNDDNNKAEAKEVVDAENVDSNSSSTQEVAATETEATEEAGEKNEEASNGLSRDQEQQATNEAAAAAASSDTAISAVANNEEDEEEEKKSTTTTTHASTNATTVNAITGENNSQRNGIEENTDGDGTTSSAPKAASTTTTTTTPAITAAATTTNTAQLSTTTTPTPTTAASTILEENDQLPPLHVGRVIGKGGEMIRDLQARSGCLRIDVDQNVPPNAPRIISYRGTRHAIDFAKQLVVMLCKTEQGKDANLPLGNAVVKNVFVPSNVIGKIIGRGGEMIRKLQGESMAKIQIDHSTSGGGGDRLITITGLEESVSKAEEMITFVCANPALDSMQGLDMFLRDKAQQQYHSQGGGGPNYYPPFPQQQQGQFGGGGGGGGYPVNNPNTATTSFVETEMFPCPKTYMGRVIGQKGVTINDLQKRSGCDIQINQHVPAGQDCQISIKGNRGGIEMAKQMLREIIDMGPNHPYAGGRECILCGIPLSQFSRFQPHHLSRLFFLSLIQMDNLAAVSVLRVAVAVAVVINNNHTNHTRSNSVATLLTTIRLATNTIKVCQEGILLIDHNHLATSLPISSSSSSNNPMDKHHTFLLHSICSSNLNNHRAIIIHNSSQEWPPHRLGERPRLRMDKFTTTIRLRKRRSGTNRRVCLNQSAETRERE